MNPFTHAHGFVGPDFYKFSVVMCQKLLWVLITQSQMNTFCS